MENFSFKRFLSLVMAFVMVLSYVPANAFAAEGTPSDIVAEEPVVEEPVVEEPEVEEPEVEEPVVEEPVVEEPEVEEPEVEEPVVEEPVVEEPEVEEPVVEEPEVEEPVEEETEEEETEEEETEEEPEEEPEVEEPEVDELVEKVQAMLDALPELPSVVTQAQLDDYQAKLAEIYPYLETMTSEQIAQLKGLQEKLYPIVTLSSGVAKVGNTEYDTIDEAIANWTNNSTLTLLADVTLPDVVTLKSTEHHILDLGTYTMTAADGKNAFVIQACGTGDAERTAITIKAAKDENDEEYLGTIDAGDKCVVYYKYADGGISGNDRPIIKIEGGNFEGSTSSWGTAGIYTIGTAARKCATLNISGGTFNCTINGSSKSKLIITGGTFNYSVGSQGDSTALRLISGGKFKTLGFMTADSNNTKFWFGTSMANSNVGLYVDKEGYLVVGGPVITEVSAEYPAVASNATKWSSYLAYSSAATYGLFYEDADMAIKKHGEANVTVYVEPEKPQVEIPDSFDKDDETIQEIEFSEALKDYTPENVPSGAELVIKLVALSNDEITYDVAPMANGEKVETTEEITFRLPVLASVTATHAKVYHEDDLMGIYKIEAEDNAKYVQISSADFSEYTVEPVVPVAMIGETPYYTLKAAAADVKDGDTIVLKSNITFSEDDYYNNGGWKDGAGFVNDQSFTIDLNNYTIDNKDGYLNDYLLFFKNNGTKANEITIKNGTLDAGTTAYCAVCTSSSNNNEITINLENVNLINNISNGSVAKIRGGAVLNVNAGTKITGKNSYLGIECVASTVNIYDGAEIYMNGTSSYNGCLVGACGNGVVNVYGGYGVGVKGGFIAMTSGGTINVSGGEWIANTNGTVGDNSNLYVLTAQNNKNESGYRGASIINVTGGTLRGGMDAWVLNDVTVEKAELNISGGNFNADPAAYVVDGYVVKENNGIYTVTETEKVAVIGENRYETLEEAFTAAAEGNTITLLADATPALTSQRAITKAAVIDLNGKTLTLTEDDLYFGTTTFKNGTIVVDPSVKPSTAVFWMFANQTLTFDNVKIVATGVSGTYLIGLDGNNSDLNLLNGSEIFVDNATALDLDIICVNASTGNDIVIDNSKVNVTNLDGRVFFRGNYTVSGNSDIDLSGITKAGFRIEAGQTLTIADTATVDIVGEPRDGGIHLTDATATYTKAETATVNATVNAPKVAKIGGVEYTSLADAAAAAQAGEEIVLLADVTEDVTLPAGVTFNGNGKQVGVITAAGEVTFKGHTKATNFGVQYVNTTINIVEGACLEITGTGRLVIGHGCTFNIKGTITDAKTADKATIQPSLIAAGASFTGAGVNFNVTNAYLKFTAYCSSKNSAASGTFNFNVTNSIWEQSNTLVFSAPTNGMDPIVNFNLKDSVLTTVSHLVFGVSKGEVTIDNSNVNVGTSRQLENRSTMTIKNGSVVNGTVATSSNAKNPGTIIVENATYAVTGEFSGSDLGTGTIIVKSGATVSAGSITKANIQIDATGMNAGDEINLTANLSKLDGKLEVINNDKLEANIVDGKIVLAAKPVAKIGETSYASLEEAFAAAAEGNTITLLADATPALKSQRAITKAAVIDLGGKTLTLTEDDLYFGTTTFKNGTIVVDPSVKPSTAVFWMFANQTLTFDAVKIVATGVTGTYLIGLEGENSDLNLLNGSEIVVENTTALDLDIICVNGSTNNDIVINNSKVNVTNLDGRVFFRGNYTVSGNSEIELEGITKAGFRIEAGQTLTIADTATVDIVGEPRDGGIHLTETTATYTKADTATVNATVNAPKAAQIGNTNYMTLSAAITAAEKGDTITFLADITEDVTINKNLTIDGANFKYTGTMTANAGLTVTVQNVNFVNGGFAKSTKSTTGTYTITDCTFDGEGSYAYPFLFKGANTITIEDCTVKNYQFGFLYVTSGANKASVKNVTVEDCSSYAVYFASGVNTATFENLTVKNTPNGFVINNTANRAFTIKDCKMENVTTAISKSKGDKTITCTVLGANDFGDAATSEYSKYVLAADATLTAPEGYTVTTNVADHEVKYADGAYKLGKLVVAKINSTTYSSLEAAVEAANAAEKATTIYLQRDFSGPGVVINNVNNVNVTIDFKGFTYTITEPAEKDFGFKLESENGTVTLKNGGLAVDADANIRILVQNFANLTVTGMKLDGGKAKYILSNNSGTVKVNGTTEFTVKEGVIAFDACAADPNALPTVQVYNTVTIKNGENTFAANDKAAESFIEAPAKYSYSTYATYYATLQQAIDTVPSRRTITLVNNIKVDSNDVVMTSDNRPVMFKVEGKSLTLDMNGKTISVEHPSTTNRIFAVVYVEDGATLKVTGNGGIDVVTDAETPKIAYMFWKRGTTGSLTIENGTYHMNNAEDSMVYTNGNNIVIVKGGDWTLDAVGSRKEANGFPWIFNTVGQDANKIKVQGGTYNYNIEKQYWANEISVLDASGKYAGCVEKIGDKWEVTGAQATVAIVEPVFGGINEIGYETFAKAIAAIEKGAPETTIKLLADEVTVSGQFIGHAHAMKVILDLNGNTLKSAEKALTVFRAGTEVLIKNGTISGNTSGGTIQVTYGGKLTLGSNVTITSGGSANALKVDKDGTLIIPSDSTKVYVKGGKNDLIVADGANVSLAAGFYNHEIDSKWVAESYMAYKYNSTYYSIKSDPSYGMQALVGTKSYYKTLQEAIASVADGGKATIKLLNDIEVTAADVVALDDYAAIYKIDNKNITINLNGKNITACGTGLSDKMIVGLFATDNKGRLTLTGDGNVSMTEGEGVKLYSLITNYEEGCTITINGGNYYADSVYDALMYSGCNKGITVNGGTFKLGNVAQGHWTGNRRNGSPWMFNVKGQNEGHVTVNGGSFNADVNNQYWIFEVEMSEKKALAKSEDGMYTVVDAVAYVTEREWSGAWYTREVGYTTLEKAFESAEGAKKITYVGKEYTSKQEDLYILSKDIKVVEIPAGFAGRLVLKDLDLTSVTALGENEVDILISGTVNINNPKGSAITGKVLNITGSKSNLTAIGNGDHAYGIGGDNTKEITISSVHIVDVKGGHVQPLFVNDTKYGKSEPEGGAAIGSGLDGAVITLSKVTIDNAQGGSKAAGIGARYHTGVTINITGSTITNVEGGNASAGIGGSRVSNGATESGTTINITTSTITAKGGQAGAGIGSGYDTHCGTKQPLTTINIDAKSTINATGGKYAAGIGTGYHNAALAGEIKSANVNAVSGEKSYKDTYTKAQDIGFGVVDPAREGQQTDSKLTYNGKDITIPPVRTQVAEGLEQDKNGAYFVTNADGLAHLNTMFADKTAGKAVVVNLDADIDFSGKTWTPVDSHVDFGCYLKEINGNGHTISNLTINGQAMFTRFAGSGDVVIKDITFDKATVNSNGNINTAVLTGHTYQNVLLDNLDVKNSSITGGYKVAPLIGTVYNESSSTITATLKNCDVENVTVKATSYDFCTTGMVAFVYADDNDKIDFENCTVSNVNLFAPNVYTAHAAIYTTGSETLFNEAEGVTVTNVTFANI